MTETDKKGAEAGFLDWEAPGDSNSSLSQENFSTFHPPALRRQIVDMTFLFYFFMTF
jgi:hypothetical protein